MAYLIGALMLTASIGAYVARPDIRSASLEPEISLEALIPTHFGDWQEKPFVQVVNPQLRERLDRLYSDTLSRTYVNSKGYMVMLSLAYGRDQRGELEAHMPEACYPGNGFKVHRTAAGQLATPFGEIAVQRLFASKGSREEPVTYWFKFGDAALPGDNALRGLRRKVIELRYKLSGRVPDGLLFRVSSIDSDQDRANQIQDRFVNQLLQAVSATGRRRLSGLEDS
jgi:EpsI family protein